MEYKSEAYEFWCFNIHNAGVGGSSPPVATKFVALPKGQNMNIVALPKGQNMGALPT